MKRMTIPVDVAQQLREAIKASGMTYRALAVKADLSDAMIAQFQTRPGKTITLESAQKLATALGMTLTLKR